MSKLEKIDKNFVLGEGIDLPYIKFYNCEEEPFKLYGIFREGDRFRRMPEKEAAKMGTEIETMGDGVYILHTNTSGGRIRFITDSPYVAISAVLDNVNKAAHCALSGMGGFDMYVDGVYFQSFIPPRDVVDKFESYKTFAEPKMREILINFPTYSDVKSVHIGLAESAIVLPPKPYKTEVPVVYYGSSITQGGCASRPGMTYQGIISRRFDCDFVNLGFSGSAKGEKAMAEYIASLDMSVFVYDYDYNATSVEWLKETHERMFKIVREKHPDIPIIIMSRPKYPLSDIEKARVAEVYKTYENAVKAGDKNVYYLSGKELMALCGTEGTVDGCHPTDFGFASMAKALGDLIEENNIL